MPPYDPRAFVKLMFWSISFLLICTYLFAGEKILHSKIKNIEPHEVDGQYCYIKVIIKQTDNDTIVKEEILECADGKEGIDTPGYWELFAQFYYSGISVPAYCRPYARPNHPFKTPGMLCLSENGVWEKQ